MEFIAEKISTENDSEIVNSPIPTVDFQAAREQIAVVADPLRQEKEPPVNKQPAKTIELPYFETEIEPGTPIEDQVLEIFAQEVLTGDNKLIIPLRSESIIKKSEVESPDYNFLQIEMPFLVLAEELKILPLETDEIPEPTPILERLTDHIQTLEPGVAEEAAAILEIVLDKIVQLQELSETPVETQNPEMLEHELEVLCIELLQCMGIKPSPKLVKHLLLALKAEHQAQMRAAQESFLESGTHEHKHGIAKLVDNLSDLVHPMTEFLGKYAVSNTLPSLAG